MTSDRPTGDIGDTSGAPAQLRDLLARATQRVLGDTIALSDEDWAAPSRLPGWSRAHVGTHLARNADGLNRLATWALTGERQAMYPSDEARDAEIEAGAHRPGLEVQEDLDTSAGRLTETFGRLDDAAGPGEPSAWTREIELRGGRTAPASALALARLAEVTVHHVDLDVGFELDAVDDETALHLLGWAAQRSRGRPGYPAVRLCPADADPILLGTPQAGSTPASVSGPTTALLGWVTQRGGTDRLDGADAVDLPSYG